MTKDQIQTKIRNLQTEDDKLIARRNEIKEQYSRPSEWMADNGYKAIARARKAIAGEVEGLYRLLKEIEDQEWIDSQEVNYSDGQV